MGRGYQAFDAGETEKTREAVVREGGGLLGFVHAVEQAQMGVEEMIEALGRAGIEAVLELSAQGVAGAKRRGKREGGSGLAWNPRGTGEAPGSEDSGAAATVTSAGGGGGASAGV